MFKKDTIYHKLQSLFGENVLVVGYFSEPFYGKITAIFIRSDNNQIRINDVNMTNKFLEKSPEKRDIYKCVRIQEVKASLFGTRGSVVRIHSLRPIFQRLTFPCIGPHPRHIRGYRTPCVHVALERVSFNRCHTRQL